MKFYLVFRNRVNIIVQSISTPMNKHFLTAMILFVAIGSKAQTSISQITTTQIPAVIDSADYFLQKGLVEKGNGRLMESFKNFEKVLVVYPIMFCIIGLVFSILIRCQYYFFEVFINKKCFFQYFFKFRIGFKSRQFNSFLRTQYGSCN